MMNKDEQLMIMDVIEDTVVDGPGFRTTVYAAGCLHHCLGCHNPQSWDMANGYPVETDELASRLLDNPFTGITFSGGDPLMQVEAFTRLAKRIKAESRKSIWCYTGFCFEQIRQSARLSMILPFIDVLVDGRFRQEQYSVGLLFRGSLNQRLIDVPGSLRSGQVCLYNYSPFPAWAV